MVDVVYVFVVLDTVIIETDHGCSLERVCELTRVRSDQPVAITWPWLFHFSNVASELCRLVIAILCTTNC